MNISNAYKPLWHDGAWLDLISAFVGLSLMCKCLTLITWLNKNSLLNEIECLQCIPMPRCYETLENNVEPNPRTNSEKWRRITNTVVPDLNRTWKEYRVSENSLTHRAPLTLPQSKDPKWKLKVLTKINLSS